MIKAALGSSLISVLATCVLTQAIERYWFYRRMNAVNGRQAIWHAIPYFSHPPNVPPSL